MRYLFVIACACGATAHAPPGRMSDGAIGGIARDRDSGDPIGSAAIHVHAHGTPGAQASNTTVTTREGLWGIDHLKPGRYDLDAQTDDHHVEIANIDVVLGEATVVDVEFALGSAATIERDYTGDTLDDAIERFVPAHHDAHTGLIEGTVNDTATRRRVAGAVISAILGAQAQTLQTVSDDQGRFRFDSVPPGTYVVSAYYSVSGHGQIEVRRSQIQVGAGDGVRVPLWVETRQ